VWLAVAKNGLPCRPESLRRKLMALIDDVKNIIVEQLHVTPEKVTESAHFVDDLGADSLDIVELVMAFEEKFAVEIPDEDSQQLVTVGKAAEYLQKKLAEKK
jgi:acyl carrier protein